MTCWRSVEVDQNAVLEAVTKHGPINLRQISRHVLGGVNRAPKATMMACSALMKAGLIHMHKGARGRSTLYYANGITPPPFKGPQ
jgi:hypothetical protein